MWADPPYATAIIEFEHHRIVDGKACDSRFTNRNLDWPLADELAPAQTAQAAEGCAQ